MNSKRIALALVLALAIAGVVSYGFLFPPAYAAGGNLHDRKGGRGHEAIGGRIADQRR